MFLVDTNVLVAAMNDRSPHHARAHALVGDWLAGPESWFVTYPILYELLRVSTHARVFHRPASFREAWSFVESLEASPHFGTLVETDRHTDVVRDLVAELPWAAGSFMHDLHTAALMREHGVKEIRTADTDFLKFRFLRVVNPLQE